jgi:hypothetical protein
MSLTNTIDPIDLFAGVSRLCRVRVSHLFAGDPRQAVRA